MYEQNNNCVRSYNIILQINMTLFSRNVMDEVKIILCSLLIMHNEFIYLLFMGSNLLFLFSASKLVHYIFICDFCLVNYLYYRVINKCT